MLELLKRIHLKKRADVISTRFGGSWCGIAAIQAIAHSCENLRTSGRIKASPSDRLPAAAA
jgi:hypothetical protein